MVDYERALGDLGFRHTEEEVLGPAARAWDLPKSAARGALGGGNRRWRRWARVLGWRTCVLGGAALPLPL